MTPSRLRPQALPQLTQTIRPPRLLQPTPVLPRLHPLALLQFILQLPHPRVHHLFIQRLPRRLQR